MFLEICSLRYISWDNFYRHISWYFFNKIKSMEYNIYLVFLIVIIICVIVVYVMFTSKNKISFYNKEKHQIYYGDYENKIIKKIYYLMGGVRESYVEKCVG